MIVFGMVAVAGWFAFLTWEEEHEAAKRRAERASRGARTFRRDRDYGDCLDYGDVGNYGDGCDSRLRRCEA